MDTKEVFKKIKATYADKGLSDKVLEVIAERVAGTATEETLDADISSLKSELTIYQSFNDQVRTLKSENEKLTQSIAGLKKDPEPANPPKGGDDDKGGEDVPKWAQTLMQRFDNLENEKKKQTSEQKLTAKLKELGVQEAFYKPQITGRTFDSDEQIEEFANLVKTQETEFLKSINYEKLKEGGEPEGVITKTKDGEISPEMKRFLEAKKNEN